MRRATNGCGLLDRCRRDFYPRPPRGGRRGPANFPVRKKEFLSTPSARRATVHEPDDCRFELISIHALREEGDDAATLTLRAQIEFLSTPSARRATFLPQSSSSCSVYFYPRPPRGGRRSRLSLSTMSRIFLSTPSARRATFGIVPNICDGVFLSTPSARRATASIAARACSSVFLSTPSARRATRCLLAATSMVADFYPRPPRGGRPGLENPQG